MVWGIFLHIRNGQPVDHNVTNRFKSIYVEHATINSLSCNSITMYNCIVLFESHIGRLHEGNVEKINHINLKISLS